MMRLLLFLSALCCAAGPLACGSSESICQQADDKVVDECGLSSKQYTTCAGAAKCHAECTLDSPCAEIDPVAGGFAECLKTCL